MQTLGSEDYPGLSEWVLKSEEPFPVLFRVNWGLKKYQKDNNIAGFEDEGRVPWAKQGGQLLEAGKGKEMDSSLKPPERKATLPTPWF